ncbi:MAG: prepilin-type N-terminal cleavage/methylation domain-containing protein [Thiobacillus sp.]|nr:prepilin-type N-terminal cleavage/methylation domain-containing protein [Thiobacillus sp.]
MRLGNCGVCRGFTMVELVLVLIVVGVIAAVAAPRMVDRSAFQTHGGAAEIRAALRYAQKLAMAKNREVCVTTNPTGLALRFEDPPAAGSTCTRDVVRVGGNPPPTPPAVATYTVTLPAGIGLVSSQANFSFDPQGRPVPNAAVSLTVGGSAPVTVEAETGYVH